MRRMIHQVVVGAVLLAAAASHVQAGMVFDNGAVSGAQVGRLNSGIYRVYEDFSLKSPTTITGLKWTQHDSVNQYDGTVVNVFSGTSSSDTSALPDNPIFSGVFHASRTQLAGPPIYGDFLPYDYVIDGLSFRLSPGTYLLEFHSNVDVEGGDKTTWTQTEGTDQTIAGRYYGYPSSSTGSKFTAMPDEDAAFQVMGTVHAAPEPSSLAIFGITACLTAGGAARRRRREELLAKTAVC